MKVLKKHMNMSDENAILRKLDSLKKSTKIFVKLKYILEVVKNKKNIKFLDVGCFLGFHLYHLSKYKNFSELDGIDIEQEFIDIGKKYVINDRPNVNIYKKELFEVKKKYDVVFMSEVIEHVDNPLDFVKKIYSLLNPGGIFIVTTPSAIGITNVLLNIKHWKNLKYIEGEERGLGHQTDHYYCWDKLTLFRLCNKVGFKYVTHHITRKFSIFNGQSIVMIVRK